MSTFVYAPGIRIYVKTEKNGTIDLSDDLVDYTIQRRSDGPSTANFSVQNIQRKYDGIFTPNDEVIIELKRVTWVRVFTGLLNSVPMLTLWPRVVAFSASCSLKRLQYWYWDPQLATSWTTATVAMSDGRGTADAGITNVILTLLQEVVGWDPSKAHIGAIPSNWFQLVLPYVKTLAGQLALADAQVQALLAAAGIGSVAGSIVDGSTTSTGSTTSLSPMGYFKNEVGSGGSFPQQGALNNAEIIIRVGKSMGINNEGIAGALALAAGESHWNNLSQNAHSTALGLFQQLAAWGTTAERTDPVWSSKAYYKAFIANSAKYMSNDPVDVAMKVNMHGSYPREWYQNHAQFLPLSRRLVKIFNQSTSSGATTGDAATGATAVAIAAAQKTAAGGIPMAVEFIREANALVGPNGQFQGLAYRHGSVTLADVSRKTPAPGGYGCSQFVSWVIWNIFGRIPSGWDLQWAEGQYKWCLANGGKEMKVEDAYKTQGALLIKHPPGGGGVGHIAISDGNGGTYESSGTGNGPRHHPNGKWKEYTTAVTMPLFDYSQAMNQGPPPVLTGGVSIGTNGVPIGAATVPYSSTSGFNPSNAIDKLFGDLMTTSPVGDPQTVLEQTMAAAFSGPRALLNDQPLLPYIKNLVNASMRSFCSAPNGDLMAWFPDYYGLWGTAAIMVVEPIELQDFYVEWTDDFFVTHQYTVAGMANWFDGFSGGITTTFTPDNSVGGQTAPTFNDDRITTAGVASIDIPSIMYALFGIELTTAQAIEFRSFIYRKFGARPDFKEMDGMVGKTAEIFSAMYYFMRQWAYQYNANIPLTFMPELWPGMLIQVPAYDFQAYITAVTHSGQMGEGGGHTTSVNVAAPARMPDGSNTHHLLGLPVASGVLQVAANVVTPIDYHAQRAGQRPGGGD